MGKLQIDFNFFDYMSDLLRLNNWSEAVYTVNTPSVLLLCIDTSKRI